ncbi:hypothetical protein K8I61_19285 [bacterium]|nr:hypothetical protein [bacterium]
MRFAIVAFIVLAFCLPLPAAAADAKGYKLIVQPPPGGLKLNAEELAELTRRIEEEFPKAMDRVVAYVGDEGARKYFQTTYVQIVDTPDDGYWGLSRHWYANTLKGVESIRVDAQAAFTGMIELQNLLAHELTHATFEHRISFRQAVDWPSYVSEGLAYDVGNNGVERAYLTINRRDGDLRKLDINYLMGVRHERRYLRERLFVRCIKSVYGEDVHADFIKRLYKGKDWKSSLASATREKLNATKKKTDACIRVVMQNAVDQSGPYWEVRKADRRKDWQAVVDAASAGLTQTPASPFAQSYKYYLAKALRKLKRYDESATHYDTLRRGDFGDTIYSEWAAWGVFWSTVRSGKCDETRNLWTTYRRWYPEFWNENPARIDTIIAEKCKLPEDAAPTIVAGPADAVVNAEAAASTVTADAPEAEPTSSETNANEPPPSGEPEPAPENGDPAS